MGNRCRQNDDDGSVDFVLFWKRVSDFLFLWIKTISWINAKAILPGSDARKIFTYREDFEGDTLQSLFASGDILAHIQTALKLNLPSIQKLYNDIRTRRENQTTLADLAINWTYVDVGDEAHHLNAQTKGKKTRRIRFRKRKWTTAPAMPKLNVKGWEHMVLELLPIKNGNHSQNVLLEFTATLPENAGRATKVRW